MKYFLAILAIFKNESMIIQEWIEHHLWQGVEHFYLIDNGSNDNYLEILQPYIDKNIVTLYYLPEKYKQTEHYNYVFNKIKNDIKWLAIIDIDEYLYGKDDTLVEYLKSIKREDIMMIITFWCVFGSNGHINHPKSIRNDFTKRSELIEKTCFSKSIISCLDEYETVAMHAHRYKPFKYSGNDRIIINPDDIRINHYQILSKEYFEKVKMNRGDVIIVERDNNYRTWEYFNSIDVTCKIDDYFLSDLVKNGYTKK